MANIPIISSYGHQVIPVPTVLLTRHTGFSNFKVHHLGDFFGQTIDDLIEHQQKIDAILIGYLDNKEQIGPIMKLLDHYPDAFVFVDPICADNGKFYHGKDQDYVEALKPLIKRADLIKPNITEAFALCKIPLNTSINKDNLDICINLLQQITTSNIVLTGILNQNKIQNILLESGKLTIEQNDYINCYYPGTGDIFDSVLISFILDSVTLSTAIDKASKSVLDSIHTVYFDTGYNPMLGCQIELAICKAKHSS